MIVMAGHYQITEKDIDSTVNYLKIFHPQDATREYARELLEYLQSTFHRIALTDPDALEELYEAFKKSKEEAN